MSISVAITHSNRVRETSSTSGTGNLTLLGAASGYRSFNAAYGTTLNFVYVIEDLSVGTWEIGVGHLSSSTVLVRDTVLDNSSGTTALINFSTNTKNVYSDVPADWFNLPIWPPRYLAGFALTWLSTTQISVSGGYAVDSTNTVNLNYPAASTISTNTMAAYFGMDQLTLAGTVSTTNGNATVTGSGTSFLSMPSLAGTGTISNVSTTVTGSGTSFLSQVSVNDLIGNATTGFYRVTSVTSDTSLTIVVAPGVAFSAAAFSVMQFPIIACGSQIPRRIQKIVSNTSLDMIATATVTGSGSTAKLGGLYSGDGGSINSFCYLFICMNSSGGLGVLLSTQRTVPYMSLSYYRRVGSVVLDATGAIIPFSQRGDGLTREMDLEIAQGGNNSRILASGNATAFTTITASGIAPPTAGGLYLTILNNNPTATDNIYVRPANSGSSATSSGRYVTTVLNAYGGNTLFCPCDGAQQIQYCYNTAAGNSAFIDAFGYEESY